MIRIFIAGDKHGFKAIQYVKEYLTEKKLEYVDLGIKNEYRRDDIGNNDPAGCKGGVGRSK